MPPSPSWRAALALLCCSLCAVAPSRAQQNRTEPTVTKKTVQLPAVTLDKDLAWQAEPNGPGEMLPFAGTPIANPLRWGTQTFAGTATGLLYTTPPRPGGGNPNPVWSMLPALYGQEVRPLGDRKGMLVLQKGKPFGGNSSLVFLDADLKLVRELPNMRGYCFGIDTGGFWFLEENQTNAPTSVGPTVVAYYDDDGQEIRRARTDGKELPAGNIHWATVGPNAVWLAVYSIKGVGEKGVEYNTRQIVRLDPDSWKPETADITAPAGAGFANLAEHIVWLEPPPDEKTNWAIQQLDKKTLEIAKAGEVDLPDLPLEVSAIRGLLPGDRALWLLAGPGIPAVPLSLEGYKILAVKDAGTAPTGIPANSYSVVAGGLGGGEEGIKLLASDKNRLWVLTGNGGLVAIDDDGNMDAVNTSEFVGAGGELRGAAALGGGLYLMNNAGALLWTVPGKTEATVLTYPRIDYQPFLAANNQRLWLTNYRQLLTIAPGDGDRTIELITGTPKPPSIQPEHMVAVGEDLYFFQWSDAAVSMVMWRGDARLSRKYPEPTWFKLFENSNMRSNWLQRVYATALTPNNQVLFFQKVGEDEIVAHFDPRSKDWKQYKTTKAMHFTVTGPTKLLGFNAKGGYEWQGDDWQELTTLPAGLKPTGHVLATTKYLYASTDNGLYRVAWDKLNAER